jgi:DNA polymerase I
MYDELPYKEIWCADFEWRPKPGNNPEPILCVVAWELLSGRKVRLWHDELGPLPPYPTDADTLFIAFYASAEIGCHLALNWPVPERILDLFTEFRNRTNGNEPRPGSSLLAALTYFGLDSIGLAEKTRVRDLIMRGPPYTADERVDIIDYCESDVAALARLLPAMLPRIDLPRALIRGRYMAASARMEANGVPIDTNTLALLRHRWTDIQDQLITEIGSDYGVFEGRTFKYDRFALWLTQSGIPWPLLDSGRFVMPIHRQFLNETRGAPKPACGRRTAILPRRATQ